MNWDAIGAIGEVLGAAVVVVSVLYLARQMRQNANAIKASNRDSMANLTTTTLLAVASDAELASLFRRGQIDPALLDDDEAFRFDTLLYSIFDHWETFYSHWRLGALSDDDWEKWASVIGFYMSQKGAQEFWRKFSENYSTSFREYVNGIEGRDHAVWRNENAIDVGG
jgi:hypothetical protein